MPPVPPVTSSSVTELNTMHNTEFMSDITENTSWKFRLNTLCNNKKTTAQNWKMKTNCYHTSPLRTIFDTNKPYDHTPPSTITNNTYHANITNHHPKLTSPMTRTKLSSSPSLLSTSHINTQTTITNDQNQITFITITFINITHQHPKLPSPMTRTKLSSTP